MEAPSFATREEWLIAAIAEIRPLFATAGITVPTDAFVSVSYKRGQRRQRSGNLCSTGTVDHTVDNRPSLYVPPTEDDPAIVLSILAHDLIHAAGIDGHGDDFILAANNIGLVSPYRMPAPSPSLAETFRALGTLLGDYRQIHVKVDVANGYVTPTNSIKMICPLDCGVRPIRVTTSKATGNVWHVCGISHLSGGREPSMHRWRGPRARC